MTTTAERAEWKRIAEAATPGPWKAGSPTFRCKIKQHEGNHPGGSACIYEFDGWYTDGSDDEHTFNREIYKDKPMSVQGDTELIAGSWDYDYGGVRHRNDSIYIATFDPPTVLRLLRDVERLEKALRGCAEWMSGDAEYRPEYRGERNRIIEAARAALESAQ